MKKIVNGLRYDTDTATPIAEWDNGHYGGDFKACEETLYKTAKGNYFLVGQGGPMSKYAQPISGGTSGGKDLIPLTQEEAKQWLEDHNCTEELEAAFPESIQDA